MGGLLGIYLNWKVNFQTISIPFLPSSPPTSALDYTGKTSDIREYSFLVLSE